MTECKLTDETKRLMIKSIENNEKVLRMFGFNLCLDQDNNIHHGNIFEGREGYIDISESVCMPTTKEIGTFYSHPSSDPTLKFTNPVHLDLIDPLYLTDT